MGTSPLPLPPSLAVTPNIPLREQTPAQLLAERAHWQAMVETAAGTASASAANDFRRACDSEILRRRDADPDAVPTGWVPAQHVEETAPPKRPTPTDWIAGPSTQWGYAILAGDSDELGDADDTRTAIKSGTVVQFMPKTDFGSGEITVHADGTWLSADRVSRFANTFVDLEGDCLGDTMDEIARQLVEAAPTDMPLTTTVYMFRWGGPVPFVLVGTPDGGFAFERVQTGAAA